MFSARVVLRRCPSGIQSRYTSREMLPARTTPTRIKSQRAVCLLPGWFGETGSLGRAILKAINHSTRGEHPSQTVSEGVGPPKVLLRRSKRV